MKKLQAPNPFFLDANGDALDAGYVFVGTAGANAETNQLTVYWDEAGTQPAAQPLRTANGYIVNGVTRARVFVNASDFSVLVKNKSGAVIDSASSVVEASPTYVAEYQAYTGAPIQTVQNKLRKVALSFYDCGAVGDGITDDTVAVQTAIQKHLANGIPLECGKGRFKVSSQIAFDLSGALKTTGCMISGDGRRNTVIVSSYTAGIPFTITSTGGAFYHTIKDIGFEGINNTGPVLQIGRDDYSDAFNSCNFTGINVNNSSVNSGCEGARVNFVLQSQIDIVSNCGGSGNPAYPTAPGNGKAVVLRQVQFSDLRIAGGNANVGLYITGGYTYGNECRSLDLEEVHTGLKIDTATATKNAFNGGAIVATYCIDATAGVGNVLFGTVLSNYAGGSIINGTNNTGVSIIQPGFSQAVNQIQAIDSTPGGSAVLAARGPDSNIRVDIQAKGTGDVGVISSDGRTHFVFAGNVANAVNFIASSSAATGGRPAIQANGSDANVALKLSNKGTAITELTGQTTTTSAAPGAATALPATPQGYLALVINGATVKLPYYL